MEKRWEQRNTESHKSVSLKVVKYYENKNKPYGKHFKKMYKNLADRGHESKNKKL